MDKRILIYFVVLIGFFFAINEWFSKPTPTAAPRQTKQNIIIDPSLHSTQTLSFDEEKLFNLVKLYRDAEQTQFVTYAIRQGPTFITLAWDRSVPDQLFSRYEPGPYANIDRIQLLFKPSGVGSPVLYGIYANNKIRIPHLPDEGEYQIRLINFSEENKAANVAYGIVRDGKIAKLSALPSSKALVIFESQEQYYVYGIFNPTTQSLTKLVEIPNFEVYANVVVPEAEAIRSSDQPRYYVLENQYQQLVFTTEGGALAEINLPFNSDTHPKSVVRKIDFDRIMQKQYPVMDTFPQYPYYSLKEPDQTEELHQPALGGYYPLLRRNIMGVGGKPAVRIPPSYYSFSLISKEVDSLPQQYQLKRLQPNLIEFELAENNRRITKTFTLPENTEDSPYCFDVTIKVEGDARGLTVTPGIPEVELISDSYTPTLKYEIVRNQKQVVESIDAPKKQVSLSYVQPKWFCNGNGFFGVIVNPITPLTAGLVVHPISGELVPSRLTAIDAEYDRFPASKYPGYAMHIPLSESASVTKYRVFAGPFDKSILNRVDLTYTNLETGENPDFIGTQGFTGWFSFISEPFAKFLFFLMNFFHMITHSWGISILLLTIALRVMLYPLNQWSIKSTLKMQAIAPKVTAIQEKYKKEPKQAQIQIMNLYRSEGVNPFSGCLPLLIQMPFLIGMFDLLKSTFELRGAPFIPGWINNLTAPDVVFSWSYPIIFFGNSFHLLPILLGVVMYLQQKYSSAAAKVTGKMTDQQRQQKFMGNIMVVVFTVMFYNFPSGLNIYWLFSMLLGILQQWWTMRKMQNPTVEVIVPKKK